MASPVGRLLRFIDLGVHQDVFDDIGKIPVRDATVYFLRAVNRQPWFPRDGLVETAIRKRWNGTSKRYIKNKLHTYSPYMQVRTH